VLSDCTEQPYCTLPGECFCARCCQCFVEVRWWFYPAVFVTRQWPKMHSEQVLCVITGLLLVSVYKSIPTSLRQHLFCGDCWKDVIGKVFRTVLCYIFFTTVVHSYKQTLLSNLYGCARTCWFRFMVSFVFLHIFPSCSVLRCTSAIDCLERLP